MPTLAMLGKIQHSELRFHQFKQYLGFVNYKSAFKI